MNEIASRGQLRLSYLRWALVTVPTIMFLGVVSGYVSGSGYGNRWFAALDKPDVTPPGWVFGTVWPLLYLLMGLALAMVLHARGARGRGIAITLFLVQLACNLAWSPLFFGAHEATLAFYLILVILALAVVTTLLFGRVRTLAAWLMVPYLVWLSFASILAYQIDRANPDAESLVPPGVRTQI
ncbi:MULTISPECIES: TspO/MBR family protein [Sphingobium]|uniref:Tryptophan-rich sensory protein n=1 Tax=Sphingobium lignivorans TaxID=2735886 RepID=A0ABR6NBR3_9SPHN|nr:TspO/MBR family protein [Sphingobium sp. SYK-6]MBB5984733.1 tryptophan-rich sensory protein [Sphingobium lignivorans]BAK65411.1 benzodiazepine receptor [Sphingobium sp. SYK-6]